jgi:hypothetical protein
MNEDFLQYIWRFQRFHGNGLFTTDGQEVQVIKTGTQNRDAGPDFLNARLRIGDTIWAGNVEVHIQASDWFKHRHQDDRAYDTVVLHVVYTADAEVKNGSGETIPTLCIKDRFDYQTWRYFKSWLKADSFIACENMVKQVPSIVKSATVQAASIDRLKAKSSYCLDHLTETQGDIEEVFYRMLLRAFGLKVNALPFEQLSRLTPFSLLRKLWTDPLDLEALLLGQAGFLESPAELSDYVLDLQLRYAFQQNKFGLKPMPKSAWKLFRLRPPNFPQVRLAQLAKFYHIHGAVAQKVIDMNDIGALQGLFDLVLDHEFWKNHFTLDKSSPPSLKHLGKGSARLILVNAVVPFLFALGRYNQDEEIGERAVSWLEQLPAEQNEVVSRFISLDFKAMNALESQGLLQLKKSACDEKKCLTCKTGIYLLNQHAQSP